MTKHKELGHKCEDLMGAIKETQREANNWKVKYEQADQQLGIMEQTIEELQKESLQKAKDLEAQSRTELEKIQHKMTQEVENRTQNFAIEVKKSKEELQKSKKINTELASEIVTVTNQNSDLQSRVSNLEKDLWVRS